MFDFDVGKLLIFGIVALAVIPPKDLPRVMRTVGQVLGKMRRMASEFQGQFMEAMREADLDSVKKELTALDESAKIGAAFDPVMAVRQEITKAVEGPKEVGLSEISLSGGEPAVAEPVAAEAIAPAPAEEPQRDEKPAAEAQAVRGAAE
jgi:sec-independent protein translocase protein TatB